MLNIAITKIIALRFEVHTGLLLSMNAINKFLAQNLRNFIRLIGNCHTYQNSFIQSMYGLNSSH